MRSLAIGLAALMVLTVLPLASPQTGDSDSGPAAAWVDLLDDPAGDVRFEGATGSQTVPERFGSFDLVALRALEGPDELTFELQVRSLDAATEVAYLESGDYLIVFTHADMTYRILASRWTEAGASGLWGFVQELDPGNGEWAYTGPVALSQDEAADVIRAVVDRALLHDKDGAAPYPGRTLSGIHAVGRHMEFNPSELGSVAPVPSGFVDAMPDEGTGDVDMPFVFGVHQTGDVQLSSQRPFRASNGEATTIVFDVLVENTGDGADRFAFDAEEVPDAWSIRFPEPSVTLGGGERARVQVLATMPFMHQHGATLSFVMNARGETGGSDAGLKLGVLFTEVPQPSGHHSRVWFHSLPFGTNLIGQATAAAPGPEHALVFNAQEDHPADSNEAVQSYMSSSITSERRYWNAWLSPSLAMGLDFDLDRDGVIVLPITSTGPMEGLDLEITLWHWASDDRESYDLTKVFERVTPAGDWDVDETRTLEVPIQVRKEADRLEVRQFQGLTLNIALAGPGLGVNSAMDPYIASGGYMDLPLFEYHDAVEAINTDARTLVISSLGDVERFVNPGAVAVFPVRVENHGTAADVNLQVTGVHADWTRATPASVRLGPHGSQEVQVAVFVPADTPDGQLVDLVLEAVADDGRAALQRVRVIVDDDSAHADDSALVAEGGKVDSPALPVSVVLLGAFALAAYGRRRQA